jgi:hypothetical protein
MASSVSSSAPSTALSSARMATGNQNDHPLGRPAEGGQQLRCVLGGKPARGAGPGIDEPPPGPQARFQVNRRLLDGARAARTAATAANWPSTMASRISAGSHVSMAE